MEPRLARSCTITLRATVGAPEPKPTSSLVADAFKTSANHPHGSGVCGRVGWWWSVVAPAAALQPHQRNGSSFLASRRLRGSGGVRRVPLRNRRYISKDRHGTILPEGPVRERPGRGRPGEALLSCGFEELL